METGFACNLLIFFISTFFNFNKKSPDCKFFMLNLLPIIVQNKLNAYPLYISM